MWPAPSITTSSVSGIAFSNWRATVSGERASDSSPEEQGGNGDVGQQVAQVGFGHDGQLPPQGGGADVGGDGGEQRHELRRRIACEESGEGGVELPGRCGEHPAGAGNPRSDLVRGQRPLPAGVGVDHDQGRDEPGVTAVELEHHRAAPGHPGDVRRPEPQRLDQRREPVREARQVEAFGQVGGPAGPWLVPGHDGELVGQAGELRLPDAAVLGRAVDQDQERPLADPLVGDPEPVRLDKLHP